MHLVDASQANQGQFDSDSYSHHSQNISNLHLFTNYLQPHPIPLLLPSSLLPTSLTTIVIYILMGSGDSRLYKPPTLKKQSWSQGRSRRPARVQQGRFRVLVNRLTSEQLQEYLLSFHSLVEFQRYLEFFQWREREDCIVNTKYLNYQLGKDFCNTSYTARVYIERIPVRLSDIEDIPFPQNLYLLLSALQGFEKLYGSVGYFRPTEDLVCMDRDGRVKAWLHADLSRCLPAGCLPEQAVHRREEALQARMVAEIVQMVEENTARDQEPGVSIREFLWRNQRGRTMTFRQAKVEVLAYAEQFHAQIPNYFQSVVGIFDEAADEEEGSSAQPPPFLKNERESLQHEAVDSWQSAHGGQMQSETKMVKGGDYERERVFAHPPPSDYEDRPGSAAYSLGGPIQQETPYYPQSPTHQQGQNFQFASYPAEYRSAPPQQTASAVNNINQNPNFKVKFNYHPQSQVFAPSPPIPIAIPHTLIGQALPAPPQLFPQGYPSPISPIMHLSTPAAQPLPHPLTIKKVASIPDQTDRSLQQKFDANLVLSSSLKNLLNRNNKLVYSDSTSTYELDEQLAEDMVKYLNGQ